MTDSKSLILALKAFGLAITPCHEAEAALDLTSGIKRVSERSHSASRAFHVKAVAVKLVSLGLP